MKDINCNGGCSGFMQDGGWCLVGEFNGGGETLATMCGEALVLPALYYSGAK